MELTFSKTGTQRVFYTCKCGFKLTIDYTVYTSNIGTTKQIGIYNGVRTPRTWLEHNTLVNCACGRYITVTELRKAVKTEHVCNSRCVGSTSGVCECSCGGANHGGGHIAA